MRRRCGRRGAWERGGTRGAPCGAAARETEAEGGGLRRARRARPRVRRTQRRCDCSRGMRRTVRTVRRRGTFGGGGGVGQGARRAGGGAA
eukprot:3722476-Prymnesium_polylepis.1